MKPHSFLALVPCDAAASAPSIFERLQPARMRTALSTPQLHLFLQDAAEVIVTDGTGAILGYLFDRSGRRVGDVPDETFLHWRASGGAPLLERHWGAYLAMLPNEDGITILRDPSGGVPCYYVETEWGLALASDAALFREAGLFVPTIDWDEIRCQLVYAGLRTERTALAQVRELLPGTALLVSGGRSRVQPRWSPYRFAENWTADAKIEDAAEGLRRVVSNSVTAWTRLFPHGISELSGGLDSSVITACLAKAGGDMECVTVRGRQADLDETRYAALVAQACNFQLHRISLDTSHVALDRSASARMPRPTARLFNQASDIELAERGRRIEAQAFFSGGTGDTVLWYFNTVTPALDRLALAGPAAFLKTLFDLAAMCGVSRTQALRVAAGKLVQRRPLPWPHDHSLLAEEARRGLPAIPSHPWLPAPRGAPRGVQAYVRSLIQMQDHFEYHDRAEVAPLITPFYAQPVIEFCLGVPSWLWCAGGRNRAVARYAFQDSLPRAILERRNKGGFDGFANELLLERREQARDMLLGGVLARSGLLDLEAIASALAGEAPIPDLTANRLLRFVSIESWLRHWTAG